MTISQYLQSITTRYKLGNSTEHTFRGDLQLLIESFVPVINATNEPKRQKCGAPDYIITKKDIPVGFIETKDIGDDDLDGVKKTGNKEQFDRYKGSLSNLIFTDYLDFHLYRDGQFVTKIKIAELQNGKIIPLPENFTAFENLIKDFCTYIGQTIKSSKKLAEMMAGKARLLSDIIEKALTSDETHNEDSTLKDQMTAFKQVLIHDIAPKSFADIYSQTIAYGLFAARLHDPTLPTFSRAEAAELIPKSNPFLRKLFGYIAGPDIDDRIKWVVDGLIEIFLACNVEELLKNYGKTTKTEDPIIHFYETFLSEYDPKLRKARGVWYTPAPVVNFIVRAVDDILKTEFGLPQGLADNSKTTIKIKDYTKATADSRSKTKQIEREVEVHKVQILDPATGTGTFLAEVVKHIYKKFEGQQGIWSNYVENHLLPRLNGFELLMASYAMAHLKLDLLFKETGFKSTKDDRLRVYLTNSLEEYHPDTGTLWANWLATEANEANHIKRDTPVMCVIGNPPYSLYSSNLSDNQKKIIEKYKYINGVKIIEKGALQLEKNLNDDYIKFIALADDLITKNLTGIVAYINNNNFLDAPTFRGMRWSLLQSFDKIYILDLHGNSNKKDICDDGSPDMNVFDIQQGVSINIFVKKTSKTSKLATVNYMELWGSRDFKYNYLLENDYYNSSYKEVNLKGPEFVFKPRNYELEKKYEEGFSLIDLFIRYSTGIVTARDSFTIDFTKKNIWDRVKDFSTLRADEARLKYDLGKDSTTWKVNEAIQDINSKGPNENFLTKIDYRPFDTRWTYYTGKVIGFYTNPRKPIMQHFFSNKNYGLCFNRRIEQKRDFTDIFVFNRIIQHHSISIKEVNCFCPLYIYEKDDTKLNINQDLTCISNLNITIIDKFSKLLNLPFSNDSSNNQTSFNPLNLLDYIYAVLYSPSYRNKYQQFLKNNFPRILFPKDLTTFWQLVKLGGELRQIHLLESPVVDKYITKYPVDGTNLVGKIKFDSGKVFINETQYFENVPEIAWNFYIGGYQPAQKWLKDRKDRKLEFEDILHYQKIIVALFETDRIMGEVDKIDIE
ncbi:MAG: DNA methyltransferase [Bacteroidetes bacterium GWF2_38_335]|nr:MAG: DNA methyltransferase [Bacteroidetes bacterium GWF2_38_335]OFY81346.1 MAG: DNA methyltransferase [Bacteroidetes bacterium RIFOXYA12_FULL_38_20]